MQAIFFDLDNTLLDRDSTLIPFLEDQHQRLGFKMPLTQFMEKFIVLDNNGYTPKPRVYSQLFPELSSQALTADFKQHYPTFARLYTGAEDVLQELHQNYKLALITNGSVATEQPKVDILNLKRYFPVVLISEQEGIKKPEPAIYHRALQALNVQASNTVMVGDHYPNDVQGAERVGIKAILKRTSHNHQDLHPYTFEHYSEFLAVLDKLRTGMRI